MTLPNPVAFKDANDWLVKDNPELEVVLELLDGAPPLVDVLCEEAGAASDNERDDKLIVAMRAIALLEPQTKAVKRQALAKKAGINLGAFDALLKVVEDQLRAEAGEGTNDEDVPETPTMGGLIEEHFLELLYDPKINKPMFAVRYPDGRIEEAAYLDLRGRRYVPQVPETLIALIQMGAIMLPAHIGAQVPLNELHRRICEFSFKYLDVSDEHRKIAAYYCIFTWVHDCFNSIGYLRVQGPYGQGKSRYVDTFGSLCYRAIRAAGSSTLSPVFRLIHLVHGSLIMDEINAPNKQIDPELEMLFKLGNSRRSPPLLRTSSHSDGELFPEGFATFGPKIFGAIKDFDDPATNSRCITYRIVETTRDDIPEDLEAEFDTEAQAIRDQLLRFRMTYWQPTIPIKRERIDRTVDRRLRQISAALLTLIDDDTVRNDFIEIMREYNRELALDREQTLAAKVVRSLSTILAEPAHGQNTLGVAYWDTRLTRVLEMVKQAIFDDEDAPSQFHTVVRDGNEVEELNPKSPRNDPKHWVNKLSQRKMAQILKLELRIKVDKATWHKNKPTAAVIGPEELERLATLRKRFGVDDTDSVGAGHPDPKGVEGPRPVATARPQQPPMPETPGWTDTELESFLENHDEEP